MKKMGGWVRLSWVLVTCQRLVDGYRKLKDWWRTRRDIGGLLTSLLFLFMGVILCVGSSVELVSFFNNVPVRDVLLATLIMGCVCCLFGSYLFIDRRKSLARLHC